MNTADLALDERMKLYEGMEVGRRLMPRLPALARIDGRSFHRFTHGLRRPFDERLSRLMIETTRFLVQETGAPSGYTQSDEISLVWYAENERKEIFFGGRIHKMVSQLAALASVYFNSRLAEYLPEKAQSRPLFDARVWSVPTVDEAVNAFIWRQQDAVKNSVSMAAREYFSHAGLHERTGKEMRAMLLQKGVVWEDYPGFFREGTFIQRRTVRRPFAAEEIDKLPERHEARSNPDLVVERQEYRELETPPLVRLSNRAGVLLGGEDPVPAAPG
jgi:tRNA(His) 5'-end guanylyltransferase